MAYGRCLRPALYSSLRSSPSHPTGVSALRVTIAIANARFARKQWGLRKSTAKSRRLFRNESATSRRVRAGAIGGSTAMGRTAFCRKSPRVPRVCWLGSWALGTSDRGGRGGQDKANWRSRTRRSSAIAKPLSAHWFLKTRRLALRPRLAQAGWRRSSFPSTFNTPADGARRLHFKVPAFYFDLVRVVAILCDRLVAALA